MKLKQFVIHLLLLEIFCITQVSFGQVKADSSRTDLTRSNFHLNYKPQEGYGIILEYKGAQKDVHGPVRTIYAIGVAKTKYDTNEDGDEWDSKSLLLEVNRITN